MTNQILFGGFQRLRDFPLDPSSLFKYWDNPDFPQESLKYYIENNPIAHPGQIVVVFGDTSDKNGISIIGQKKSIDDLIKIPNIKVTDDISKVLGQLKSDFDIISVEFSDVKTEVSNTLTTVEKTISDFETDITAFSNDIKDKASQADLSEVSTRVKYIEENHVSADALEEKLNDFVKVETLDGFITEKELNDIFGGLTDEYTNIADLLSKITEIKQWIDTFKVDFDGGLAKSEKYKSDQENIRKDIGTVSDDLAKLTVTVGGKASKEELQSVEDIALDNSESISKLTEDLSALTKDHNELSQNFDQLTTKVNEIITFQNVEQVVSFEFGKDKQNSIKDILKNTTITELRVKIITPATEDIMFMVSLLDNTVTDVLVPSSEIILSEGADEFIYEFTHKITDTNCELFVECSDFKNCNGIIFVKYFSNK